VLYLRDGKERRVTFALSERPENMTWD